MREIMMELAQIPDGTAATVQVGPTLKLAVFRVGERVAVIDDRCPHAGGSLGQGAFDGTVVQCPLHGFRVDVWKGIGNSGKPVKTFPATITEGRIHIAIPD